MSFRLQIKNLVSQEIRHQASPASTLLIGRSKICDIVLNDSLLSRQHCSLEIKSPSHCELIDLQSANGSFVDGQKIDRKELTAQSTFRIGDHEIRLLHFEIPKAIDSEDLTPVVSEVVLALEEAAAAPAPRDSAPTPRAASPSLPSSSVPVEPSHRDAVPTAPDAEVSLKTPAFLKQAKPKALFQTKDWLQVSLLWKDKLVNLKCFDRGDIVRIGEDESNDFALSLPSIPKSFYFMKVLPTGIELVLHPAMKGLVETKSGTVELDDLRAQARQTSLGLAVLVPFSDRCLIEMGPFSFFIQVQKLSLIKPLTAPLVRDPLYVSVLSLCFALFAFAWIAVQGLESAPKEEAAKEAENLVTLAPPTELPKVTPTPPPPPPAKKAPESGARQSTKADLSGTEGAGARAAGEEGKAGRTTGRANVRARPLGMVTNSDKPLRSVPKGAFGKESNASLARRGLRPDEGVGSGKPKPKGTGTQAPSAKPKPVVKVEDTGISGALSSRSGGGGTANSGGALSGSGLGGELEGSVQGLERGSDLDARGSGGRGAKGLGLGGGGTSVEVGGLSTKGQGGGSKGFGLGTSGKKGDADVSYSARDVEVRDGLTREEIEAVVRKNAADIQTCYEQTLAGGTTVTGRLKVEWFVNRLGRAEAIRLGSGPANAGALFECIGARIRSWEFPKPRGGSGAQVSWPWVFRKG